MEIFAKVHPPELKALKHNYAHLILRVRNNKRGYKWYEAEIEVPKKLSLSHDYTLTKARVRLGILHRNEYLERHIRLYASPYTNAGEYNVKISVFAYGKDGVIDERMDAILTVKVIPLEETIIV